jgi:cell wall-associated NlpC family hydrolase
MIGVLGALVALLGSMTTAAGPAGAQTVPRLSSALSPATGLPNTNFWLATPAGQVWGLGDVPSLGSVAATPKPIVDIATTRSGLGYWLTGADGGVFSFGDAGFFGSAGGNRLNQAIVAMTATPDGGGYWLLAADGGVFSFGDARFFGSTGAIHLNQPIVAMTATPDGGGYWLLAADGGVFNFGRAPFAGSRGADPSVDRAQRLVATSTGAGYWIFDGAGSASAYGDATGAPKAVGLMFRATTRGQQSVQFAFQQLGKPYIWGGNGPVGYDCSGLVLASWRTANKVSFARVANDQYRTAGGPVPLTDLQAGDLVFWGNDRNDWSSVYHAAMYVGGGRIVEATGDHVQVNSLGQWGYNDLMPQGRRP